MLGFVYARKIETSGRFKAIRAPSVYPLRRLAKRFTERLAAEILRLPREFANREVRLLLAGAGLTEGYTPYLHYRPMETWALGLASHLAR